MSKTTVALISGVVSLVVAAVVVALNNRMRIPLLAPAKKEEAAGGTQK